MTNRRAIFWIMPLRSDILAADVFQALTLRNLIRVVWLVIKEAAHGAAHRATLAAPSRTRAARWQTGHLMRRWVTVPLSLGVGSGVFQFYATITNVRGEHHDRFPVPRHIDETVAVQRAIDHFDYGSGRNHDRGILAVKFDDC
jgi:hypothetical protein